MGTATVAPLSSCTPWRPDARVGGTFDRPLRDALKNAGCIFMRDGKGSHEIWWSPVSQRNFTVPNGTASRHTANAVLKDAGLPKQF